MLGVAVWIRFVAEPAPELSGQRASGSYDYSGFTGVDASGQWEVAIERGDAWRIAIDAPEELLDDIEVELEGDELSLGYEGECAGCFRDGNTLKATVTMPELESLDLSGATKLSFSGFDGASLSLDMSGASELRGAASRFDSLILDNERCWQPRSRRRHRHERRGRHQRRRQRHAAHGRRPAHRRHVGRRQPRVLRHGQRAELSSRRASSTSAGATEGSPP